MNNFIIMTDSTTDLNRSFYDTTGSVHIPHGFVLDSVERKDIFWTTMSEQDFFTTLKNCSSVSTTQPEMEYVMTASENAFKQGKDVLYVCFSSKLSGTYDTSCMIAKELMEKYPERKMYVLDSL